MAIEAFGSLSTILFDSYLFIFVDKGKHLLLFVYEPKLVSPSVSSVRHSFNYLP